MRNVKKSLRVYVDPGSLALAYLENACCMKIDLESDVLGPVPPYPSNLKWQGIPGRVECSVPHWNPCKAQY